MLSLPSKPWKKVRIDAVAEHRYRIVFLSDIPSEAEFLEAVEEDLRPCLGAGDELGAPDWPSRSAALRTLDLPTFKRNLVYASIMVEIE